jgi:DnaK suppressor protein
VLESYGDPSVDFGCCRDCGEPIPLPRLKALPDALFCVPCAETRE